MLNVEFFFCSFSFSFSSGYGFLSPREEETDLVPTVGACGRASGAGGKEEGREGATESG